MADTATLLLTCRDQPGIAAAVTAFLFEHGANVLHADQHRDPLAGVFFQRLEVEDLDGTESELEQLFAPVAAPFDMAFSIRRSSRPARVAVLCSRQPHCLDDLLSRWRRDEMPGELAFVASNHDTNESTVTSAGYPFHHLPIDPDTPSAQQEQLLNLLNDQNIDLVVLARYMQILPAEIVGAYSNRIINIHHSFLPAFPGARPYHQAHAQGVKLIGATAHYATADLDEGPIIEQDVTRVGHQHAPEDLERIGRDLEVVVLARAVRAHLTNRVLVYDNKTVVFT